MKLWACNSESVSLNRVLAKGMMVMDRCRKGRKSLGERWEGGEAVEALTLRSHRVPQWLCEQRGECGTSGETPDDWMFHRLCWDWQDGSVFISLCRVYFFKWACLCRQMLAFFNWPINMRSEDLWQKKTGAAVAKEELKTPGKPENQKSCNFLKIGNWTLTNTNT